MKLQGETMINGFGPTSFDISIGGNSLSHCIQLTATGNPGEFTMSVGRPSDGSCADTTLNPVATLTLDDDNTITKCTFTGRFGSRNWQSMTGTFETDDTGSGAINDDGNPRDTNGTWSAGDSQPVPQPHERKHGHHA
jgi:hypothetical protein